MRLGDLEEKVIFEGVVAGINIDMTQHIHRFRAFDQPLFPTGDTRGDIDIFPKLGKERVISKRTVDYETVYFWDYYNAYHRDVTKGRLVFYYNKRWYYFDIGDFIDRYHVDDIDDVAHHIFSFIEQIQKR